jgi:hypothetical protein
MSIPYTVLCVKCDCGTDLCFAMGTPVSMTIKLFPRTAK